MKAAKRRQNEDVERMLEAGEKVARIATVTGLSERAIHYRKAARLRGRSTAMADGLPQDDLLDLGGLDAWINEILGLPPTPPVDTPPTLDRLRELGSEVGMSTAEIESLHRVLERQPELWGRMLAEARDNG